jgi:hypothetical protein
MSSRSAFLPKWARPAAKEIDVLVLPVPPFCDAMLITMKGKVTASNKGIAATFLFINHYIEFM